MNKGFGVREVYDFVISDGKENIITIDAVKENDISRRHGLNRLEIKDALLNPHFMDIILQGKLDGKPLKISGITTIRDLDGTDKTKVISIQDAYFGRFEYEMDEDRDYKIRYYFEFGTDVRVVVI